MNKKFLTILKNPLCGGVSTPPPPQIPNKPTPITISQKKIKEWLNQPHKFYREKNELLLDLPEVFKKAVYKGETIDPKVRPGVGKSHIFEIELCGEPSYIIIHEMTWHEYQIHSISDHIKM